MPSRYNLPHIDMTSRSTSHEYVGDSTGGSSAVRIREEHGRRVQSELRTALQSSDTGRQATDRRLPAPTGTYLEIELRRARPRTFWI
jgi:hypothetical protein